MPYCIKCGKPMAEGAQYCYYCGQRSPYAAEPAGGAPVQAAGDGYSGRHAGAPARPESASFSIPYSPAAESACPAGAETARRQSPPRRIEGGGRAQAPSRNASVMQESPSAEEQYAGQGKKENGKTGLIVFAVVLCLLIAAEVWLAYSWFLA